MERPTLARLSLAALALVGTAILATPEATAITYGEPDCTDIATNTGCRHPNTVSLSGFRKPTASEDTESLISFLRCSGTLLSKDADRFVVLTAGHCASAYLSGLQDGSLSNVGVSFDALIVRDLPQISPTVWSPTQFVLDGKPVLPAEYGPQGAQASNLQFDYAVIVFDIPAAMRFTEGGELVDLTDIVPIVPARTGLSPGQGQRQESSADHRRRLWYGRGACQARRRWKCRWRRQFDRGIRPALDD